MYHFLKKIPFAIYIRGCIIVTFLLMAKYCITVLTAITSKNVARLEAMVLNSKIVMGRR